MAEFKDKILKNEGAKFIYNAVKDLPVIDYHCHLSPKEIYEDKQFANIGELWLAADHYKWRLMRQYGIAEEFITGKADIREKYNKFVEAVSTAFGNPIKDWVAMELEFFFGITLPLNTKNADKIWELTAQIIEKEKLSPRKMIEKSQVEYIATTDDICDSLSYHKLLQKSYSVTVVPSFRTDNLFLTDSADYLEYIKKLSAVAEVKIDSLDTLKRAIKLRIIEFKNNNSRFSDIGINGFPTRIAGESEANNTFLKLLNKEKLTEEEKQGFAGHLYLYLGKLYKEYGFVMQLHLAVIRNTNSVMFEKIGRDSGFDNVAEIIDIKYIQNMLNRMNIENSLPETVVYTLNPNMYYPLVALCGAFTGVHTGIAWWFNDHKRGMEETFKTVSELGHIANIVGMLTDSRSFLSYVRHDYYRLTLCEFLSAYLTDTNEKEIMQVAYALCYGNAKKLLN